MLKCRLGIGGFSISIGGVGMIPSHLQTNTKLIPFKLVLQEYIAGSILHETRQKKLLCEYITASLRVAVLLVVVVVV